MNDSCANLLPSSIWLSVNGSSMNVRNPLYPASTKLHPSIDWVSLNKDVLGVIWLIKFEGVFSSSQVITR